VTASVLLFDAGALVASVDRAERRHEAVRQIIDAARQPLVTSQIVLAEVDYLLLTRGNVDVESAFLADVAAGAYAAECLTREELNLANQVILRYRDLEVGLADASMVVLAARFGTSTIVTLDERCFRAMQPLDGGHFTLLPADG
jgi:predicted nucleic acid-binding protein